MIYKHNFVYIVSNIYEYSQSHDDLTEFVCIVTAICFLMFYVYDYIISKLSMYLLSQLYALLAPLLYLCHDGLIAGQNRTDASSIGLVLARYRPTTTYVQDCPSLPCPCLPLLALTFSCMLAADFPCFVLNIFSSDNHSAYHWYVVD